VSKEPYYSVKRALLSVSCPLFDQQRTVLQFPKSPTIVSKEPYYQYLAHCLTNREPYYSVKEPYYSVQRALLSVSYAHCYHITIPTGQRRHCVSKNSRRHLTTQEQQRDWIRRGRKRLFARARHIVPWVFCLFPKETEAN